MRKFNISKTDEPSRKAAPWQVRWRSPDQTYNRRGFKTKGLAERFIASMVAILHADAFAEVHGIPWDHLVSAFLDAKIGDKLRPSTIKEYEQAFDDFAAANVNPLSTRISLHNIDRFKTAVSHNSAPTINKKLRHLAALFNWAVTRRVLGRNPISRSTYLREDEFVRHIITQEEFYRVLDACPNDQWHLLIQLGAQGTGRRQDLVDLEITAIDFDAGTVKVMRKKQRKEVEVPIHRDTLTDLANYIDTIPAGQTKLFTCKFSNNSWLVILKRAEVVHSRFHDLRTAMVNWMDEADVPSSMPTQIFGHSDPKTVHDKYRKTQLKAMRSAINRLSMKPPEKEVLEDHDESDRCS